MLLVLAACLLAAGEDAPTPQDLIRGIADTSGAQRLDHINRLVEMGEEAVGAIGGMIQAGEVSDEILPWCLRALGRIGGDNAPGTIEPHLIHREARVRAAAVRALAAASEDLEESFTRALLDKDSQVRLAGVEAVGKLGKSEDREKVLPLLGDENIDVRVRTGYALKALASKDPEFDFAGFLTEALGNLGRDKESERARAEIAALLADTGDIRALPVLRSMLRRTRDTNCLLKIIRALGASRDPGGVRNLAKLLGHESPAVRNVTVTALGRIGGKRSVDAIREALNDSHPAVRKNAARALKSLGQE